MAQLETTTFNTKELGRRLERIIKTHEYSGAKPGHVDMFAVFAALTELQRVTAQQMPYQMRVQLCTRAIEMLEAVRRDDNNHHVKLNQVN